MKAAPWTRGDLVALGLLALLILGVHARVLLGDAVYCFEDLLFWFGPMRTSMAPGIAHHALDAAVGWNAYAGIGRPFAANAAIAPLYPLNLLQLTGDGIVGLSRMVVFHLFLAGAFTHRLARNLGARPAVALIAGCAFAFSGPLLSYAQENPEHVFTMTWLPLATSFFLQALGLRSWRRAALAGAAMGLMMLAGEPQVWFYTGFILGALALAWALGAEARGRAAVQAGIYLAVVVAVAIVVSATQIVAILGVLGESARAAGLDEAMRHQFAMHPARLSTFLLPYATGALIPENSLWGSGLGDGYRYWIHTPYVGLIPLLFAPFALRDRRAAALAIVAVFFTWMALGAAGGLYPVAEAVLPGMKMFRYPEKWIGPVALLLPVLGAVGLERWLAGERRWPWTLPAAAAVGVAALAWVDAGFADTVAEVARFPAPKLVEAATHQLTGDAFGLLLVCGAALAWGLWVRRRDHAAAAWILAAVAAVDVAHAGISALVDVPPLAFTATGPLVDGMTDPHARYRRHPHPPVLQLSVDEAAYAQNLARMRATGGHQTLFGERRSVFAYGVVANRDDNIVHEALFGDDPVGGGRLLGVRYYLIADQAPPRWIQQAAAQQRIRPLISSPELRGILFEDPDALPRAYRVHQTVVEAETQSVDRMKLALAAGFDFRRAALIDADDAIFGGVRVEQPAPAFAGGEPGTAEFERDEPDHLVVRTAGAENGVLVVADTFARGWRAWVDDTEVPIWRANTLLRGIPVPPGEHRVTLRYETPGLAGARLLTLFGGGLLLLLGLVTARRQSSKA